MGQCKINASTYFRTSSMFTLHLDFSRFSSHFREDSGIVTGVGAVPYLFPPKTVRLSGRKMGWWLEFWTGVDIWWAYQRIVAMPRIAARQLNTKATIPLVVKPAGKAATCSGWPLRSNKFFVFPAALPEVWVPLALQT